jgi:hypothetical protein
MRKLISSKTLLPMRGGHGWTRPDVPLTEDYIHKREVSLCLSRILFSTVIFGSMMTLRQNIA